MRQIICCAAALLAVSGCYTMGQSPRIRSAEVTPKTLVPGSEGLITVAIADSYDIVDRVEGTVAGVEPPIVLSLYDDGTHGDVEAGDDVWSFGIPVPLTAPVREYPVTLTAYTSDGLPVEVRTKKRDVVPLQVELPVVVAYPKK